METVKVKTIYGTPDSKYLKVYLENSQDLQRFLGHGVWNKAGWVNVENNLINQMLLGMYESIDPLPLKFNDNLKPYQKVDVGRIIAHRNILNRNPMGLGKTVEAVAALKELQIHRALIVVPKPCIAQWIKTFKVWYPAAEVSSDLRADGIVVTNYEQVAIDKNLMHLKTISWEYLIVDEAHRLKNRKSKRTCAIKQIPAQRRMAMTGTPVLRRLDDLWSVLNFLDWKYSGLSYWNFVYYFCQVSDTFWGKQITGITDNSERLELLSNLLSEISIYNRMEIAQGKIVTEIPLAMEKSQRTLYDNIRKLVLDELPEDCSIPNGAVCTMRLRQVTSYPGSIDKNKKDFWGIKFQWIRCFAEDHPGTKICIFTKFETAARALTKFLNDAKITSVSITGKIDEETRYINKQKFLKESDVQCFIGTIDAIGQGFDELQNVCNVGVFLDKDFSPMINEQVEERLHRMGQQNVVFIYYLTCEKSFDERVGKINISKANDIRRALQDEEEYHST